MIDCAPCSIQTAQLGEVIVTLAAVCLPVFLAGLGIFLGSLGLERIRAIRLQDLDKQARGG